MSALPAHTAYHSSGQIVTGTGRVLTPIPADFEGKAKLEAAGIIAMEQLPPDHELLQPQSDGDETVNLLPEDFPKADALTEAGFGSLEEVVTATLEELTAIGGIGETTAQKIQAEAARLLADIESAE